ncbi:uncharacterized protein SCHCODRAFT_02065818 [Schizophyllum commune H4-8]|uniref:Uncharacterized protein n=1 Tax=Schizophyllum commune (strain H4-8 / FGSC 9210) TaxID=578458 RepID=D8QF12_SCHCM|nr:uncharacterized protein SCHCODRAFT_02065818 [Schizophyllum commune H4-8]KAI5887439.1 hypothetical protein SCHCODRAFT_02065818 [Schizophyllum commune H4-8]
MREDNPFDDPAHFELPAHVFLPSHPITAEPGLREATAYLTLHSIMLKAHAMAMQSWTDASRDDDSYFTAVDDLNEKAGMEPAHDDDQHDDRSSLLPPRRPNMSRGRATYDGMSTFGVTSKWGGQSSAAASDTNLWLKDAADEDRSAVLDAHAKWHEERATDDASLHSIFHGHVARRPPNARRATSASYTFRKPTAPSAKPSASSSKLSVPSYTRRNISTSCVGAKRERKASMASAHFNEIHEKIHRWGIKTHLEDEDEDVVPLMGREEEDEEDNSESNADSSTTELTSPTSTDPFTSDSEDDSSATSRSSSPTSTTGDEVSPSPRRPWWKRVVSCNGLLGRRMRYARLD